MESDYKIYLDAAIHAAREAGRLIYENFESEKDITFKDVTDMVTDTDRKCESTIVNYLTGLFPDHKFLGEEVCFKRYFFQFLLII